MLDANVVIFKPPRLQRATPANGMPACARPRKREAQESSIQKNMQTVLLHMRKESPGVFSPGENGSYAPPPSRFKVGGAPLAGSSPPVTDRSPQPGRWTIRVSPPFQLATRSSEMMLTWLPDVPTKCIPRLRMA